MCFWRQTEPLQGALKSSVNFFSVCRPRASPSQKHRHIVNMFGPAMQKQHGRAGLVSAGEVFGAVNANGGSLHCGIVDVEQLEFVFRLWGFRSWS